jgi:hypothetical protein
MNQSNHRGQTLDRNHLIHDPHAGPAGLSIGAGSEAQSTWPATGDLRAADPREEFLAMVLHELKNPSAAF